jgi:hypothetical protein
VSAFVSRATRVHRIPPHVRDDRDTPLGNEAGRLESIKLFLPNGEAKYFFRKGWTGNLRDALLICPTCSFARNV